MQITIIPDGAAQPEMPKLSNSFQPSIADLVAFAAYMRDIVQRCDVTASPHEPNNPYAAVGAMAILTQKMHGWLVELQREEERNLLLMERLRHEERQERAHEELMATDDDYADEWDGEGDDE